jgi:undecaprenyl-diphosphatase
MNPWQALSLGILQGMTEFLPVSSSGHLVIAQKLFGFSEPPVLFDVLLHLGTLGAILIFFKNQFLQIRSKLFWLIVIGTLPAVIVGKFLNNYIDLIFNSWTTLGYSFLLTALFLFSTLLIKNKIKEKDLKEISWQDALIIGIFQAIAILPGVSRSGSTVVGSLWRRLNRETAFLFSFYLVAPAILGAAVLKRKDGIGTVNLSLPVILIGVISAFFSGLISLRIFKQTILKGKLSYFGIYCLVLGIIILLQT